MTQFAGTGVAVVTPFTETGAVDYSALARIIEHLIAGKVEYLVVLGTTGESVTLTPAEQQRVIATFFDINAGRLPIVIGVGGNNTASICNKLEEISKSFQPAGILSVSPYYNKPNQEGIYQHYRSIASHTDLPIILYNVPGRTASNITAQTTIRLARDFSNIVAIKEASGDLVQCMEIVKGRPRGFQLISGDDILTLPMMSIGGQGVISVLANAFPLHISEMVRNALAGNWQESNSQHYRMLRLMQLAFLEGNPTGIKAMMQAQGLCTPDVRLPLVQASAQLQSTIAKELAQL
ncbi:MAG: 4-hydroxy-tetrahydrodipicolinate synthase [Bacteroidetes bacterium]|nr:MAG: 4-hydroxy-tetrahydrodipicolinate synthase [Bacteroidota bacterium]